MFDFMFRWYAYKQYILFFVSDYMKSDYNCSPHFKRLSPSFESILVN